MTDNNHQHFPRVLHETEHDGTHYRLVETATDFLLERCDTDAMGEPSWCCNNDDGEDGFDELEQEIVCRMIVELYEDVNRPGRETPTTPPHVVTGTPDSLEPRAWLECSRCRCLVAHTCPA